MKPHNRIKAGLAPSRGAPIDAEPGTYGGTFPSPPSQERPQKGERPNANPRPASGMLNQPVAIMPETQDHGLGLEPYGSHGG